MNDVTTKDIKSALRYVKHLKEENTTPSVDIKLTTVVSILEKQIPKKVRGMKLEYDKVYFCPTCEVILTYDDCHNCGQKLIWD